jgi:hypothetical protein
MPFFYQKNMRTQIECGDIRPISVEVSSNGYALPNDIYNIFLDATNINKIMEGLCMKFIDIIFFPIKLIKNIESMMSKINQNITSFEDMNQVVKWKMRHNSLEPAKKLKLTKEAIKKFLRKILKPQKPTTNARS